MTNSHDATKGGRFQELNDIDRREERIRALSRKSHAQRRQLRQLQKAHERVSSGWAAEITRTRALSIAAQRQINDALANSDDIGRVTAFTFGLVIGLLAMLLYAVKHHG